MIIYVLFWWLFMFCFENLCFVLKYLCFVLNYLCFVLIIYVLFWLFMFCFDYLGFVLIIYVLFWIIYVLFWLIYVLFWIIYVLFWLFMFCSYFYALFASHHRFSLKTTPRIIDSLLIYNKLQNLISQKVIKLFEPNFQRDFLDTCTASSANFSSLTLS